jgi:hypothetical protein
MNTIIIMKKKIALMVVFCLCFYSATHAQVAPSIVKRFPAHIVYQIDNIVTRVNLDEAKQLKIGQKFIKQDSIANALLAGGAPTTELKNYYPINKTFLSGILSSEEMDAYWYALDQNNRFLLALKMTNTLKLTTNQINDLRKQNDFLEANPIVQLSQKSKFYKDKLASILDKNQYDFLIKTVYATVSKEDTNKDWQSIKKRALVKQKDSSVVYNELYEYHLYKNSALDVYSEKYNEKEYNKLNRMIVLQKQPALLIRYNIVDDYLYDKNIFSEAIKYEKELKLSQIQMDSLVSNYRTIEIRKFTDRDKNPFLKKSLDYYHFEHKTIVAILDPEQINQFLILKNKNNARQLAYENWDALEKNNMVKDVDKKTALQEIANYQLKFLVASDRLKMNKSAANTFYKRDVELKKPELLKQLDELKRIEETGKTTKNALKW